MGRRRWTGKVVDLVAFNHEGLDDIVTDHLKVGMSDPMTDGSLGTGEEVVEDGNVMTKEHKAVDKVRPNETSAASDQDALALGGRKKFDGREASESCVRDRVVLGVIDGLGEVLVYFGVSFLLGLFARV
jgi:hypothetical protein